MSQFSAGKDISAVDNPPYSPNLAPPDFWLYPNLKSLLKINRYSGVEDIKSALKKNRQTFVFRILKTGLNNGRSLENMVKIGGRLL
jgi:hypothetical protein